MHDLHLISMFLQVAKELVACVSSSPPTSSWICDLWLHAFVTLLGNVVQSVLNAEHFSCDVVVQFFDENARLLIWRMGPGPTWVGPTLRCRPTRGRP